MFHIACQTSVGLPTHADVQDVCAQSIVKFDGYLGDKNGKSERILFLLDLIKREIVRGLDDCAIPNCKAECLYKC